ncbi:MAG: 3-phosphoglycerate dehydrogenase [Boseongicola sp.]|nr:MAG: 3-phosphoglycerate dehydrogenase [Boseongicola sp.]
MQDLTAESISQAEQLRLVSRHGVGFDAVDVDALSARGIPLSVVGDVNAQTVAEHAMMLLLSASHRVNSYDKAARPGGNWDYRNSLCAREISGKTLLIVGFGRIGRLLARMVRGFDVNVLAFDPFLDPNEALPVGVTRVDDLHSGLGQADMVSLHMPKLDDRPVLAARELALLPSHAVVVNTARGGLVDEVALSEALANGKLHSAGLDVFEAEPPSPELDLLKSDKVVLTPHIASMTSECAERMAVKAAQNILDVFSGNLDPALVINSKEIGLLDSRA